MKPLDLYMLVTVWSYLMISYALLEVKFSGVMKVILDNFVCRKGIPFIFKNICIVRCSCGVVICLLAGELSATF